MMSFEGSDFLANALSLIYHASPIGNHW